jgi:hypothetical protein
LIFGPLKELKTKRDLGLLDHKTEHGQHGSKHGLEDPGIQKTAKNGKRPTYRSKKRKLSDYI